MMDIETKENSEQTTTTTSNETSRGSSSSSNTSSNIMKAPPKGILKKPGQESTKTEVHNVGIAAGVQEGEPKPERRIKRTQTGFIKKEDLPEDMQEEFEKKSASSSASSSGEAPKSTLKS